MLIFLDTKRQVTRLYRQLKKNDFRVDEIHGDKSQNYRSKAIQNFKSGKIQIMVATDVASRGIDIDNISLVVNYHIPGSRESYVHRIGRTGRAGRKVMPLLLSTKVDPNPQNQYKTNRLYKRLPKCFSLMPKGAKSPIPRKLYL